MELIDLTPTQADQLCLQIDKSRQYYERLLDRMAARSFPATDPLYRATRMTVQALRELYLTANRQRRKCDLIRAVKRAKNWKRI